MKNSNFKKQDTRSHFSDIWHKAKSWRNNKKIGAKNERRKLNKSINWYCTNGEEENEK